MAAEAAITQDYLFDSAYSALYFAYRYSPQQYAPTPISRLMRSQIGSGKGLHGLDAAAQSGIIRAEVEAIGPYEKNAIVARFATDPAESLGAKIALLVPATASLGTGIHHHRMVDGLVQKYYGRRIYLKEIAEMIGATPNTMTKRWACIRECIRDIEYRAMDRAEERLRQAGLIP